VQYKYPNDDDDDDDDDDNDGQLMCVRVHYAAQPFASPCSSNHFKTRLCKKVVVSYSSVHLPVNRRRRFSGCAMTLRSCRAPSSRSVYLPIHTHTYIPIYLPTYDLPIYVERSFSTLPGVSRPLRFSFSTCSGEKRLWINGLCF